MNSTTLVILYTPPRSTCHQPVPSHADMYVMSEGPMVSMLMTPFTPISEVYATESSEYCPEEVVVLNMATFVYVLSNTNSSRK